MKTHRNGARHFTDDEKLEYLRQAKVETIRVVAARLKVHTQRLGDWKRQLKAKGLIE